MRRLIAIAAGVSLLLNVVGVWVGRGSFFHTIAAVGTAAYVGLPAFIAGSIFWALRARYGRAQPIARAAWVVSAIALSTLLSLWPGHQLASRDVDEAKAYCEQLAGRLDEYRARSGAYPPDLTALRQPDDGPRLVRGALSYSSDGSQFELLFSDPRALMEGLAYHSGDRRWVTWD